MNDAEVKLNDGKTFLQQYTCSNIKQKYDINGRKKCAVLENNSDLSWERETKATKQQNNEQNYSAFYFKQL